MAHHPGKPRNLHPGLDRTAEQGRQGEARKPILKELKPINTIDKIREKLKKYPGVTYQAKTTRITFLPQTEDGFPVTLTVHPHGFTVSFSGWHEEFQDEQEAIDCFGFGLSERYRLKVLQRGRMPYKWVVQSRTDQGWTSDSETGLIFFPFWLPKRERHLQNHVVKIEENPEAIVQALTS